MQRAHRHVQSPAQGQIAVTLHPILGPRLAAAVQTGLKLMLGMEALVFGWHGHLHGPVPDSYLLSSCLNLRSSRS